ncbi:hypothetical protein [Nitrosomonas supralitoralis]|uniref:Uncharacterized protein n=1 Tax=Nitrosomonas supralitoralis TaxID=2116706 RepID=A0A2P7NXB1_9PROT|nr:hypothetical protein [Nitrosomonas supralitoralis]PSJ18101.1 hypothetical protein C7H79_04395 [Nitrosomonas supralitoralis]
MKVIADEIGLHYATAAVLFEKNGEEHIVSQVLPCFLFIKCHPAGYGYSIARASNLRSSCNRFADRFNQEVGII